MTLANTEYQRSGTIELQAVDRTSTSESELLFRANGLVTYSDAMVSTEFVVVTVTLVQAANQ